MQILTIYLTGVIAAIFAVKIANKPQPENDKLPLKIVIGSWVSTFAVVIYFLFEYLLNYDYGKIYQNKYISKLRTFCNCSKRDIDQKFPNQNTLYKL